MQDRLGQSRRYTERLGIAARLEQDLAFAGKIAGTLARGPLDLRDSATQCLTLGDPFQQLPVDDIESGAKILK